VIPLGRRLHSYEHQAAHRKNARAREGYRGDAPKSVTSMGEPTVQKPKMLLAHVGSFDIAKLLGFCEVPCCFTLLREPNMPPRS
jgi:hypothetical protein